MTESNKMAERMSMNVEELQWRIRNNYELPVGIFTNKPVERLEERDEECGGVATHFSDDYTADRIQVGSFAIITISASAQVNY